MPAEATQWDVLIVWDVWCTYMYSRCVLGEHAVFDSMVILSQLLLQLVLEASRAFGAKMKGFKCALGKLPGTGAWWHSGPARKHLPQIRAPLKCFTKSALSLAIVPRAIEQTAMSPDHSPYSFSSCVRGRLSRW